MQMDAAGQFERPTGGRGAGTVEHKVQIAEFSDFRRSVAKSKPDALARSFVDGGKAREGQACCWCQRT